MSGSRRDDPDYDSAEEAEDDSKQVQKKDGSAEVHTPPQPGIINRFLNLFSHQPKQQPDPKDIEMDTKKRTTTGFVDQTKRR